MAVDWIAISENQDDMIDPEYLPPNFMFRDPSKMKKVHFRALLDHWYRRQEDERVNRVFAFKGYWDVSSNTVIVVDDDPPGRHKPSKQPMRKQKNTARTVKGSEKRPGPPGIRVGDIGWTGGGEEDEDEMEDAEDENMDDDDKEEEDGVEEDENSEGEDEDEDEDDDDDDDVRRHGAQSKAPPMDLPFSAKRRVPRVIISPKVKCQLPAAQKSKKAGAGRPASKTSAPLRQGATLRPKDTRPSKSKKPDHTSEATVAKKRIQP